MQPRYCAGNPLNWIHSQNIGTKRKQAVLVENGFKTFHRTCVKNSAAAITSCRRGMGFVTDPLFPVIFLTCFFSSSVLSSDFLLVNVCCAGCRAPLFPLSHITLYDQGGGTQGVHCILRPELASSSNAASAPAARVAPYPTLDVRANEGKKVKFVPALVHCARCSLKIACVCCVGLESAEAYCLEADKLVLVTIFCFVASSGSIHFVFT